MERDALLARFYDLEYSDYSEDIEYYLRYASLLDSDRASPILELGCGTGRVSLALAEAGYNVVGVDTSPGMLAVASEKATRAGVGERLRLRQSDMRNLAGVPEGRYSLAFCALNTFAYLLTTGDQLSALRATRSLIRPGGALILDITPPSPHFLVPGYGELLHQGTYEGDNYTLHKFVTGTLNYAAQTQQVTVFYDQEMADGSLKRISQQLAFRWSGLPEIRLLLAAAGFGEVTAYGGYDLEDYDDLSARLLVVANLDHTQ